MQLERTIKSKAAKILFLKQNALLRNELVKDTDIEIVQLQKTNIKLQSKLKGESKEVSTNLNIGDELIKFQLSDSNLNHIINDTKLKRYQYGKVVKRMRSKLIIKLIFVISEDEKIYDVYEALNNPDDSYRRTLNGNGLDVLPPSVEEIDHFVKLVNSLDIDVQSRWDNTTSSRWVNALGRKGDTRAKGSVDILKSVVDVPLCDEIISKLKELRGDIETISKKNFRANNILCLYCGQNNATEKDHYMSVVRNGKMNMYLDVNTNWVPSCSECNRSSGKDNKNSLQDPLAWWKDEDESLRSKHPTHPQNILAKDPEALRERGIIMQNFDDFFHEYAPKLPEEYWNWLMQHFDDTLDEAYANMKKCFGEFDKRDEQYKLEHHVTLDLVAKTNEKFMEK
jgi:hypothetical protein